MKLGHHVSSESDSETESKPEPGGDTVTVTSESLGTDATYRASPPSCSAA